MLGEILGHHDPNKTQRDEQHVAFLRRKLVGLYGFPLEDLID